MAKVSTISMSVQLAGTVSACPNRSFYVTHFFFHVIYDIACPISFEVPLTATGQGVSSSQRPPPQQVWQCRPRGARVSAPGRQQHVRMLSFPFVFADDSSLPFPYRRRPDLFIGKIIMYYIHTLYLRQLLRYVWASGTLNTYWACVFRDHTARRIPTSDVWQVSNDAGGAHEYRVRCTPRVRA